MNPTPKHKDTTLDEIQSLRDKFNQGGMNYSQIVGEENTTVSMQLQEFNAALIDIIQWRNKAVVEAYNKGRQTEAKHTVDYMELNDFSRDVVLAHTKRRLGKIEAQLKETPNED